ncbi:hypothetical protein [Dactylosporangium sp. NPDC050588]|uniref:hypothetical protein n=1 Tax=Dactylosporangium sp. NPDC050588 TaxID=3157211 RepID=UPI0033EDF8F3
MIVRASGDDERARVTEILIRLGLAPVQRWATEHAVSFEVDVVEPAAVERVLDGSELGFTVVPPGAPDYLLRELYVQGPDGSRFRLVDAPAMQALGNVATEIVDQYSLGGDVDPPTVIDVVGPGGDVIRASSGETLHEAGVRDGDSIRVGFEGRAGAVHPEIRIHALQQARRQVTEFAEATPGMRVHVRAGAEPPIEYDLEFERPSFGPPGRDTGEPTLISRHIVRLLLGSDFPEVPPTAFWLTPFFHPNVFPTYDCPETARTPGARGLVCLGAPADEWNPGTRLHEICQTIVDIAGYRNYDVAERIDAGGMPRGNFFDEDAAAWAAVHGDEIARRGGRPPVAPTARRPFVRVTGAIERIDG